MIKPTKFLDLDNCILKIASNIILLIRKNEKMSYTMVYNTLKSDYINFDYTFLPAIDFLFLLGIITYSPESDCLELII